MNHTKLAVPVILLLLSACQMETHKENTVGQTSAELSGCEIACYNDVNACEMDCIMDMVDEEGFEWCMDDCYSDLNECMYDDWRYKQPSFDICHIDTDLHLFDTDIEFYTVDIWEDRSCAGNQPNHYKKRYLGKISCSHLTVLGDWIQSGFDEEELGNETCGIRLSNFLAPLLNQGYVPTVSDKDVDECPTPRL